MIKENLPDVIMDDAVNSKTHEYSQEAPSSSPVTATGSSGSLFISLNLVPKM